MTDQPPPQQPHPGPPQPPAGNQPGPPPHPPAGNHPGPPPGPPVPPPDAALKLTVQGHALTSSMVPPTITIDGHRAPSTVAGSTMIPIRSGRHRLEASAQWLRTYGRAAMDVDIPPQTTVEVFYAPPFHQFTDGAMGLAPQQRKGKGVMLGCLIIPIALMLVIVVIAAIGVALS